ncbi:LuxR family transcriptional regulator [Mycobacterium mantenii]|uniref:LuxR family transcriptional regulator n=1 Tax=Mycobacterium mantenii TaxID=560555 RepID=A0A1X0FJ54_MYCNT|nr:helix-turn-helix transcriptional regulator [Mycobacterium mantenii]MCV7242341.1 AAA family ATPase [Mycobacterium mantenii]ORB01559.1 LuxR family transcriptional regulator [Mycobacterium mantenii]BBY37482.1 LuxR family transcriptional regulator [Mycobacterium mantenii]
MRRSLAALSSGDFYGAALVGDSGLGKSTLARMLAKTVESAGRTVRFALGTQTGRAVPLGAFSRALSLSVAHEPAVMLAAAHNTLCQDKNLVVVVDDAHLLDPLSATLVNQLVAGHSARLIVTIQSGEPVLDAVTALLKERLLLTVHVDPFTREQTELLAGAVLGGPVDTQLVDELLERSAGKPLLLRSFLTAGRASGALVHTEDRWQLGGPLRGDRELHDALEFRLQSLSPGELEVVELLATAEELKWEVLRDICDPDAVAALERRGLIQLIPDGSHTVAQLNHPMLGEAATRHAGMVRSRQLNGKLARALQKHQRKRAGAPVLRLPGPPGRIRLAQFMMRSDLEPDLDVVITAAADALATSDVVLGEELARFAVDRDGGLPAALVLAEAVSWQGRGEEADSILINAEPDGDDDWLIARWGCLRAANLFWGCMDVEAATRVLDEVKKRVASELGLHLINVLEMSMGFFQGEVEATLDLGPGLCAADLLPMATVWAALPTCGALALAGRFSEVSGIADAGVRATALCGLGPHRFNIGMTEIMAATAAGDDGAAERIYQRYAAQADGLRTAEAMVDAIFGLLQLSRGALPSACALFTSSVAVFAKGFSSPWLLVVAALKTQAEAARGDCAAAAAALRLAERAYGPHVAVFLPELELARAWERAVAGDTMGAQGHALQAAQIARATGMHAVEMRARHTAVRFGDTSQAPRLLQIARFLNTAFAEAIADHARGLAQHDGDQLDAAAHQLADVGALASAADASAQAASEHARRGDRGKKFESAAWAHALARRCELRTPALNASAHPLPFSARERQIVTLVAAGLSNRQIADRLVISVRTVEGHLYRLFTKLGINTRDQLICLTRQEWSGQASLLDLHGGSLGYQDDEHPHAG